MGRAHLPCEELPHDDAKRVDVIQLRQARVRYELRAHVGHRACVCANGSATDACTTAMSSMKPEHLV